MSAEHQPGDAYGSALLERDVRHIIRLAGAGNYDQAYVIARYMACQLKKMGKLKERGRA